MDAGTILAGVGSFAFIGYLIWLIVAIRNWDSKIPAIIGMILSLIMLFGGAATMVPASESPDPPKAETDDSSGGEVAPKTTEAGEVSEAEKLLAFDERTWEDFKTLYAAHNNLMEAMADYSDGKITTLDFYNYCEEAKDFFASVSLSYDYGEDEDQKTYLSVFESAALADQGVAQKLMKYLDTLKVSDLDKVQDEIESAKAAFITIASNRGTLLVNAGLSEEEIRKRVDADTADLD